MRYRVLDNDGKIVGVFGADTPADALHKAGLRPGEGNTQDITLGAESPQALETDKRERPENKVPPLAEPRRQVEFGSPGSLPAGQTQTSPGQTTDPTGRTHLVQGGQDSTGRSRR